MTLILSFSGELFPLVAADLGDILQSRCGDLIDDNVEGENEDDHDNDEVALNYTFKYNTCLTE